MAAEIGFELVVAKNDEGIRENVSPMSHRVHEYTRIMRTVPLLASLDTSKARFLPEWGVRDLNP